MSLKGAFSMKAVAGGGFGAGIALAMKMASSVVCSLTKPVLIPLLWFTQVPMSKSLQVLLI